MPGDLAISRPELLGVFIWLEHPSIDTRNVRCIEQNRLILILDEPWTGYIFNDPRPINFGCYYKVLIDGVHGWIKEEWIIPLSNDHVEQKSKR